MSRWGVLLSIALCAAGCSAAERVGDAEKALPLVTQELIDTVNRANAGWVAGWSSKTRGVIQDDITSLCGMLPEGPKLPLKRELEGYSALRAREHALEVPETFDARTYFSNCSSVIGHIRDQANCGSCWAMAVSAAFNDRVCIASQGEMQLELSSQELTSCCLTCGLGCFGGNPAAAWTHCHLFGLVSGGDYGNTDLCYPYGLPMCDHHVEGQYKECSGTAFTPLCKLFCPGGDKNPMILEKKYKAHSAYSVEADPASIQQEIMQSGPVSAGITVYTDFLTYQSGVYRQTSGSVAGGHAVRIIGWGVENGTDYWLVANSWNNDWGMDGFFKIRRGTDECGIESSINAGEVKWPQ